MGKGNSSFEATAVKTAKCDMTSQRKRRAKAGQKPKSSQQESSGAGERDSEDAAVVQRRPPAKGRRVRKCRLKREYQRREREVQSLMANANLSESDGRATASGRSALDDEVAFFCEAQGGQDELTPTIKRQKSKKTPRNALSEEEKEDEEVTADEQEDDTDDDEEQDEGESGAVSDVQQPRGIASKAAASAHATYIQIEELNEQLAGLGAAQALLVPRAKQRHAYADIALLYLPARQLQLTEAAALLADGSRSGGERRRLVAVLNRYWTEAQMLNIKLSPDFVAALLRQRRRAEPRGRYRSHCSAVAHEFHPIYCPASKETGDIPTRKLLQLQLCELRFDEHPAAGEEHRLANRLDDMYEQHVERRRSKQQQRLAAQLLTERKVLEQLMQGATREATTDAKRLADRLAEQTRCVRTLRQRLYAEEAGGRQLLQQLLDAWRQLKRLRQTQGYQCTRFQLRLHVDEPAEGALAAAQQQRWTQRYESDLNECYREALEEYYHAKRMWRRRDVAADEPESAKPQRPHLKLLAAELRSELERCIGAPGEPALRVWRVSDEGCYSLAPSYQPQRFYMKLYADREFVGVTRTYRLSAPDCRLEMHEAIGIVLQRRLPKQLRIALYEKCTLAPPRKVADMLLPLPQSNAIAANASSAEDAVEAAPPVPPLQKLCFAAVKRPIIAGRLLLRCQCVEQTVAGDANNLCDVAAAPASGNSDNSDSDAATAAGSPMRATALQAAANTCTFEEQLLQFCSISELQQNARFRLLRSRHQQSDARTRELRLIPALAHELAGTLDDEEAAAAAEAAHIETGNWMDPIDVQKHQGKKRLRTLYETLSSHCERLAKTRAHSENLLIGDEPASWSSFFRALGLIFQPQRSLQPRRLEEQRQPAPPPLSLPGSDGKPQQLSILLMVVRATGIPVRDQRHTAGSLEESQQQQRSNLSSTAFMTPNLKYSNVRPFIALSYRDKLCRTATAEGSNPTWNEQLVLPISGNLSELRDDIRFSLYDELFEQQINSAGDHDDERPADIYQRVQTNWLGEYRVAIASLLARTKMEGVVELQTPRVLIGYRRPALDDAEAAVLADTPYPQMREAVHVWFYLSCEPSVALPPLHVACLECVEAAALRQHLQQWSVTVRELQPQRYVPPLVCTAEGKRICLTRLLQAVPLPVAASENLLESACRYVALLAVLRSQQAQHMSAAGWQGVWLNNRWLLDGGCGSAKDLGVLLCNFMLSMGLQCWLVLGVASPWGECAYVLYRGDAEADEPLWLVDPGTGRRYALRDVFCPLSRVHYVVAPDNIYCNVQREQRVAMTSFNLQDSACWLPAFSKRSPAPTGGVQQPGYAYGAAFSTQELRLRIERKIMKKIGAWRTMRRTIWNRAFQPRLLAILEQLERAATFSDAASALAETRYAKQLAAEFPNYKLYGFTLNFAYTNLAAISERIKATSLHLHSDPRVEFALAVHVHAYAQNVLSVWIFLLSIVPAHVAHSRLAAARIGIK